MFSRLEGSRASGAAGSRHQTGIASTASLGTPAAALIAHYLQNQSILKDLFLIHGHTWAAPYCMTRASRSAPRPRSRFSSMPGASSLQAQFTEHDQIACAQVASGPCGTQR